MRKVWISGGAKGIGRAAAARFVGLGDEVCIGGRDESALAATAAELGCSQRRVDVSDEASVKEAFATLDELEVLVLNAGISAAAPLHRTELRSYEDQMAVNSRGVFLCAREALPLLRAKGQGRILVVASTASLFGAPYTAAYTASKHAALGLVRTLAAELAGTRITANAVCPTFVDTEMTARSIASIADKTGKDPEEARKDLEGMSPLGRLVRPEEVAAALVYLASEEATCINGQTLVLDGGGLQH